jgi:formamidopyrimidine-DNA glycosylase
MPELPEVETVRRILSRVLEGQKIVAAEFPPDTIVQSKLPEGSLLAACDGARVERVGRHGKFWWIELDRKPWVFGHLGMAGWIRELGEDSIRLREHGQAPFDDEAGRPRFLKMLLQSENGRRVAMTDGRRLARLWLGDDSKIALPKLGPDMYLEPWTTEELAKRMKGRSAPIKALLLDQTLFCGVGNWIADEVLYQARIAPQRQAGQIGEQELDSLISSLSQILKHAVDVGANSDNYPKSWLFHYRWGGAKGHDLVDGAEIQRDTVGGRTTAWVPALQH